MSSYQRSGVDLEAAAEAVELIRRLAKDVTRPEVVESVGGFAGLFRIGGGRLLAAATDGVGTKTEIARLARRFDTIGIDLVAMCADDVVCTGAEPLFFLDYIAVGKLDPAEVAALVAGVAEGCRMVGCALLGGETAEHPGVLEAGRFDLAGFCVGMVEEREQLGPHRVHHGDVLVGLPSSGLHSNGFSLVRSALLERYALDDEPHGLSRPLAEELLEPTRIYAPLVHRLHKRNLLHAAAHITGGGFVENIPRALPEGFGAEMDRSTWHVPSIFDVVQQASGASDDEMFETFNMGLGMVLVVPPGSEHEILEIAEDAVAIGRIVPGSGVAIH